MKTSARVKIGLSFAVDEATEKFVEGLDRLLEGNGAGFVRMLRMVMNETIMRAYRERFHAAEDTMRTMRRASPAFRTHRFDVQLRKAQARLDKLRNRRSAYLSDYGDSAVVPETLERRIVRAEARIEKLLAARTKAASGDGGRPPGLGEHPLGGSGLFTRRMKQIYSLLSADTMTSFRGKGGFGIRLGGAAINRVRTPSHAEVTGKGRPQRYEIMWRHLEFGTGLYARPTKYRNTSPHKEGAGWWYGQALGRKRFTGPLFKGSKGGHFLRAASGLAYTSDAVRFELELGDALHRALKGL